MRRLLLLFLVLFSRPASAQIDWRPNHAGNWKYKYLNSVGEPKLTAEERKTVMTQLRAIGEVVHSLPMLQSPRGVEVEAGERIDLGCNYNDRFCQFKPLPAWTELKVMGYANENGKIVYHSIEPPGFTVAINDPFTALHSHEYAYEHVFDENGNEIFYGLQELARVNGAIVYDNNVVVLTNGRPLTTPVTAEQYLKALLKHNASSQMVVELLQKELAALDPIARKAPAYVGSTETISSLVPKGTEGAQALVTINRNYYNPALPRTAVQLIAIQYMYGARYAEDTPTDGDWTFYSPDALRVYQVRQTLDYEAIKGLIQK